MTTLPVKLMFRMFSFMIVGISAAVVHLGTVFVLVSAAHVQPLLANIFAFFLAFNISFFGHKYLTFSQLNDQKKLSLPHFFFVASSAGLINELLYFFILHHTHIHYLIALVLVLGLVSIYSVFLSRFWACR